MIYQEGFRAYLHVPDFMDPTRRSQTYISLLMSLLRERFFVHDGPRGLSGLLACAHDFLDPTRRSQTSNSLLMSLLRYRFLVHD